MKKGMNTKKASKSSDIEVLSLIQQVMGMYRVKAQTGKIDRAYHVYFADLEASLQNVIESFQQ